MEVTMTTTESIHNQLVELRLGGMRATLDTRLKGAKREGLCHVDFFGLMVQDEIDERRSSKIKRLVKRAAFRQPATIEQLDTTVDRGIDKRTVNELSSCRFIDDAINVIIMGQTGVGKTYLATAIGNTACRLGYSTLFFRMNSLVEQLILARAKGTYLNLLKRLAACDLLILDDFGIKPLEPQQYQDLYDVIDERGEEKSLILTSQTPPESWNDVISDPVSCEAITDRISTAAIKIVMHGPTQRAQKRSRVAKDIDKH
jgi:DNA replication protein DnaC